MWKHQLPPKFCLLIYNAGISKHVKGKGKDKGKSKVYPTTGHEGPYVEYRYKSTLSLISALDGGGWSRRRLGSFTPRKYPVLVV
jgi:hypothetical protein